MCHAVVEQVGDDPLHLADMALCYANVDRAANGRIASGDGVARDCPRRIAAQHSRSRRTQRYPRLARPRLAPPRRARRHERAAGDRKDLLIREARRDRHVTGIRERRYASIVFAFYSEGVEGHAVLRKAPDDRVSVVVCDSSILWELARREGRPCWSIPDTSVERVSGTHMTTGPLDRAWHLLSGRGERAYEQPERSPSPRRSSWQPSPEAPSARVLGIPEGSAISWMTDGACIERQDVDWFPNESELGDEAKAICRGCRVTAACLEHALARHEYGVWGGTTERERRTLRKFLGSRSTGKSGYLHEM